MVTCASSSGGEAATEISLVVCTRDRAAQLERTLARIEEIECPHDWELVVVDNASRDRTPDVIRDFSHSTDLAVRHEREPVAGLSRARNRGCRAARGEILALTDDDCYPASDHLDEIVTIFRSHDVDFLGGRILRHDPEDAPLSVREETTAEMLPPHSFPWAGFIQGANMAFRAEVFHDLGGFDESIGSGTPFPAADIEFCARASDRGWRGGYFPAPTVHHHHGRKPGPEVDRLRAAYARGRGAYYVKGMLDYGSTSLDALKRWYWSARRQRGDQLAREAAGAVRYLARRMARRGSDGRR